MTEDKLKRLHKFVPDVIAILLIMICAIMIFCGKDGLFPHILTLLVGYYFGQKSTTYR
jgi:hypothetical protein